MDGGRGYVDICREVLIRRVLFLFVFPSLERILLWVIIIVVYVSLILGFGGKKDEAVYMHAYYFMRRTKERVWESHKLG